MMVPSADLRIYLLPQVDDSLRDRETTEEMLRILSKNEVKIVTRHLMSTKTIYPLTKTVQKLKIELREGKLEKLAQEVPLKIITFQSVQPVWQRSSLKSKIQDSIYSVKSKSKRQK